MDLQEAFDKGFEGVRAYIDTEFAAIRREFADQIAKSIPAPVVLKDVRDGVDGRDGIGLAGAVIGRDGDLVITLSNGDIKSLGQIIGKDGADGLNGKDGQDGQNGRDGSDGRNGKDVDMEAVMAHVEMVARGYLEALPAPKDGRDGIDGKSVDPIEVAELVSKAVSEIPMPQNGADGKDGRDGIDGRDGTDVDHTIVEQLVSERVSKAIEALPKPVDGIDGRDGRDGIDGKSIDHTEVVELVAKAVSEIPIPKDGRDGIDGKDGASVSVEDIEPLVIKVVSAIPLPENGKDGANGRDGQDGLNGQDGKSVTIDDITPLIADHVSKAVSEIPKAKDGRDGIGVKEVILDNEGQLILTLDDGTTKIVGKVVGPAGKDGFNLKDFDAELMEDGRTVLFSFSDGYMKQSAEMPFPTMIYRGIYADGKTYERGDTVTWAGSLWHCEDETVDKPGDGSKAWTLAAKRGRDGKDFRGPETPPTGKVKL